MVQPLAKNARRRLFFSCLRQLVLFALVLTLWLPLAWLVLSGEYFVLFFLFISLLVLGPYLIFLTIRRFYLLLGQVFDLIEGPRTLVGYVTHTEAPGQLGELWRGSRYSRPNKDYRLIIIPANAFDEWRGKQEEKPQAFEDAIFRYDPGPDLVASPTEKAVKRPTTLEIRDATPQTIKVPQWVYERVRLGDLVRLVYARRTKIIFEVEVILTVGLNN